MNTASQETLTLSLAIFNFGQQLKFVNTLHRQVENEREDEIKVKAIKEWLERMEKLPDIYILAISFIPFHFL